MDTVKCLENYIDTTNNVTMDCRNKHEHLLAMVIILLSEF